MCLYVGGGSPVIVLEMVLSVIWVGHSKLHAYRNALQIYGIVCDKGSFPIVGKLSVLIKRFDEAWRKSVAAQGVLGAEVE